ncbi:hypothetical protein T01_2172 [Trichinella spiralis]|uniref:Uncharacterized protein n=1 Tax=Trichinella spiralis TaxID=6334 RepID=A0A0V1B227_TRISP|nr:hypothetical protein T01_2172 [Trichinella spiralis]
MLQFLKLIQVYKLNKNRYDNKLKKTVNRESTRHSEVGLRWSDHTGLQIEQDNFQGCVLWCLIERWNLKRRLGKQWPSEASSRRSFKLHVRKQSSNLGKHFLNFNFQLEFAFFLFHFYLLRKLCMLAFPVLKSSLLPLYNDLVLLSLGTTSVNEANIGR